MRNQRLEHLVLNAPIILATYAASSEVLGYGFGNPVTDLVGLASTSAAYLATERGISKLTQRDGVE